MADIQYYLKNIGLTLSPVKSQVIWAESFRSSLKGLSEQLFLSLAKALGRQDLVAFFILEIQDQVYTLLHTYPARLLTPSGCTFHVSIGTELNW